MRHYLEKTLHKKGLMEWLEVKALSSAPVPHKEMNFYSSYLITFYIYDIR
jgi:hypothetical protein